MLSHMEHSRAIPAEGFPIDKLEATVGMGVLKADEVFGFEGKRFRGEEPLLGQSCAGVRGVVKCGVSTVSN